MSEIAKLAEESTVRLNKDGLGKSFRPIDLVFLARQTLGDVELEKEVLIMFDNLSKTYLRRLQDKHAASDFALNAHSLKGAALGVGASSIAEHAKCAESEFRDTGAVGQETMNDLVMAVEEVSAFIDGLIKS